MLVTHVLSLVVDLVVTALGGIERCWPTFKWHSCGMDNASVHSLRNAADLARSSRRAWETYLGCWQEVLLSTVRSSWSWNHLCRLRLRVLSRTSSVVVGNLTALSTGRGVHIVSLVLVVHAYVIQNLLYCLGILSNLLACCSDTVSWSVLLSFLTQTYRFRLLIWVIKLRERIEIWLLWRSISYHLIHVLLLLLLVVFLLSSSVRCSLGSASILVYHLWMLLFLVVLRIAISNTTSARVNLAITSVIVSVYSSVVFTVVCSAAWLLVLLSVASPVSSGCCFAAGACFSGDTTPRASWREALFRLFVVLLLIHSSSNSTS